MTTIELQPAYMFDCTACGVENFIRAVVVEFNEQDVLAMQVRYGVPAHECRDGSWMSRPDTVTCKHCGATYDAVDRGDEPA